MKGEISPDGTVWTAKKANLDFGATYTVQDPTSPKPKVTVQTEVIVGPKINTDALKKEITSKKSSEIKAAIELGRRLTRCCWRCSTTCS